MSCPKQMFLFLLKKSLILVVNVSYFIVLQSTSTILFQYDNEDSFTDSILLFLRSFHCFALFSILWLVVFMFRYFLLFMHHMFFSSLSLQKSYTLCTLDENERHKQAPILIYPNYQWFTMDLFHIQLQRISQTSSSSHDPLSNHNDSVFHVNPWTYFTYVHLLGIMIFALVLYISCLFPISFCIVSLVWTFMVPFIFKPNSDLSKCASTKVIYLIPSIVFMGLVCIIFHVVQHNNIPYGNAPIEQLNFLYIILFMVVLPLIFAIFFIKMQTELHYFDINVNTLFNFLVPSIAGISSFYLFLYAYVLNIFLIVRANEYFPQTIQHREIKFEWIFILLLPLLFFSMTFYFLKSFLSNDILQIQNLLINLFLSFILCRFKELSISLYVSLGFLSCSFFLVCYLEIQCFIYKQRSSIDEPVWIEQSAESIET